MLLIEIIGSVVTVLAVIGVILNNRKFISCFYLWLISNGLSLTVHLLAGIWSLAIRDAIFWVLAWEGLYQWRKQRKQK